jgi:hypothetical protein
VAGEMLEKKIGFFPFTSFDQTFFLDCELSEINFSPDVVVVVVDLALSVNFLFGWTVLSHPACTCNSFFLFSKDIFRYILQIVDYFKKIKR